MCAFVRVCVHVCVCVLPELDGVCACVCVREREPIVTCLCVGL